MPGYTYEEITRVPQVMGVVQEFRGTGSTLQRFYNLGLNSRPGQTIYGRSGVYDIFNPTRSMPVVRAPMAGPARVGRKPIGQKAITLPRFYEALTIEDEYVFRNRPLGGQYSQIDDQGRTYIARQIAHETTKFLNVHEFMAASMFRGGWGLAKFGEDLIPVPKDSPDSVMEFDTLVPVEHTGQIPLGTGGADIIDIPWDDPDADLSQMFFRLNKVHAARHGAPLRHVWGNGTTLGPLLNNTRLQRISGTSVSIFSTMTGRMIEPGEKFPDTGVDIKFAAMPDMIFHIYNQVVQTGLVRQDTASLLDGSLNQLLIPDGEVFITPEPGDWCELVAGSEPIQYDKNQSAKVVSGFDIGRAREIHPPRWDLMFWSCQAPILVQELATYNATVIFS